MAWNLQIHHIDVGQGDSTLIVAREIPPLLGVAPLVRSVLIDGGLAGQAGTVHNYITGAAGANLAALNVLVVTHYDQDHFNGVSQLVRSNAVTYDNTIFFDQGWPGGGLENPYINYVRAINGRNPGGALNAVFGGIAPAGRARVTNRILSWGVAPTLGALAGYAGTAGVPAGVPGSINQPANWLVGREVMWTNGAGAPTAALWGGMGAPAPGTAGGPPSLLCIAANERVLQPGGGTVNIPSGLNPNSARGKNARSLVFLLRFEGFHYYIGGDILSQQEDNVAGIGNYLVNVAPAAIPVHAMKASHHGSGESTSNAFLGQLQPNGVFISCGTGNNHGANPAIGGNGPWPNGHPQQALLQNLQASGTVMRYYMTQDRSNIDFCRRINQGTGIWPMGYTAKARVAGAWGPPQAIWGGAAAGATTCNGQWPNDTAPAPVEGHVRIITWTAIAPNYWATRVRPRLTMPILNTALLLPAGVIWPAGQALPPNTQLPLGAVWPGGVQAPLTGAVNAPVPFVLAAALPWPNGQTMGQGVVMPGGAMNMNGFTLTGLTTLPAGVMWTNAVQLPIGGVLPTGTVIPLGWVSPNTPGVVAGSILAGPLVLPAAVAWPNGVALPTNTIFPAGTVFPAATTWPAGIALPAGVPPFGTNIPVGATLPPFFAYPAGTLWPAGAGLPQIMMPAGTIWPAAQALPLNTRLPLGGSLVPGIQWPIGVAIPVPAAFPAATGIELNPH